MAIADSEEMRPYVNIAEAWIYESIKPILASAIGKQGPKHKPLLSMLVGPSPIFRAKTSASDTDRSGIQASRHLQLHIHNNPPNSEMTRGELAGKPWWTCRLNVKYMDFDMTRTVTSSFRAHFIPKASNGKS